MKIKAVKFTRDGFMMKSFAFGGGLEKGAISPDEKMPSCLQNYLIDTGTEVILVDTGLPMETPDMPPREGALIYVGKPIQSYMAAFKELGYNPEQVTKILVTHKHPDHTGELRSFPNAKIYISRIEADALKLQGENIVRVDFTDGAYQNFEKSQKIADGIHYIFAPGHTLGNSIVIIECEELFYLIHGDVTYTDEALHENRLSVVFENLEQARDTLNRVREFVRKNPTIYLSTHTPQGYQNLESKKIMQLSDNDEYFSTENSRPNQEKMNSNAKKWICSVCGYEHYGNEPPQECPICGQPSDVFQLQR